MHLSSCRPPPPSPFRALVRDRRGAVYVEFLAAFLPIFIAFECIAQLTDLFAAKLVVQHAAYRTARAGAVVFPDDDAGYEGGTSKRGDVETAAHMILEAKGNLSDGSVSLPNGTTYAPGSTVDVVVQATYTCGFPIADRIVCSPLNRTRELSARARMPAHAVGYSYPGGCGE